MAVAGSMGGTDTPLAGCEGKVEENGRINYICLNNRRYCDQGFHGNLSAENIPVP